MGNAASAIIIRDRKILLIRRGRDAPEFPGFWTCPGGVMEKGESPEECAAREVKEEVGLDFVPTELFFDRTANDGKKYRFLGRWKGSIRLQKEETEEYGWFSFEEAIKLPLAFDYRKIIKKLHSDSLL
ncbi:MAG: NUDIX hydrolase [Candidatus Micrarchaeota archaeon]|nr:NUDIX hydrolase [Candidatus Micrarchaeota archaeon]